MQSDIKRSGEIRGEFNFRKSKGLVKIAFKSAKSTKNHNFLVKICVGMGVGNLLKIRIS